jgi:DNA-binding MarR family transcriptional regulator
MVRKRALDSRLIEKLEKEGFIERKPIDVSQYHVAP